MDFQISILVNLLILNFSDEYVYLRYLNYNWKIPQIGPRPPYYTNPRYKLNYPII